MGRIKRGGYLIEWWIGDHWPKHVHIYRGGKPVAKVQMPSMLVLRGTINRRIRKILTEMIGKGKL